MSDREQEERWWITSSLTAANQLGNPRGVMGYLGTEPRDDGRVWCEVVPAEVLREERELRVTEVERALARDEDLRGQLHEARTQVEEAGDVLLRLWRMTEPGDECPQETVHSILHDFLTNEGRSLSQPITPNTREQETDSR